jgi:hypothetical protein
VISIKSSFHTINCHQPSKFEFLHTYAPIGAGADLGFNASTTHQQALATGPFGNTCEANAVSPKAAKRGVAGHRCLQPGEYQVELIQQ